MRGIVGWPAGRRDMPLDPARPSWSAPASGPTAPTAASRPPSPPGDDGRGPAPGRCDSGASGDLLGSLDALRVVAVISRRYCNPPGWWPGAPGPGPATRPSALRGQRAPGAGQPGLLDIAPGEADVVAICGAEAWRTRSATPCDELGWTEEDPSVPRRLAPPGPTWRWSTRRRSPGARDAGAGLPAVRAGTAVSRPAGRSRTTWSG